MIAAGLSLGGVARAHIVVDSKTVRELVADADLVLRAHVTAAHPVAPHSDEAPGRARPSLDAAVQEVLKGTLADQHVGFVQHGHGVATFEPGRSYLLFLVDAARTRELGALAASGEARFVSLQEHDDAHALGGPSSDALLAAVRGYVSAGEIRAGGDAAKRDEALHAATMRLLTSGDEALVSSALRDLVARPDLKLLAKADANALLAVVDDRALDLGVRAVLLRALEQRSLADGLPRWLTWLADDAPTGDLVTAIRAAATDQRPAVHARLLALLASDRDEVAAAAAIALSRSADAKTVAALAAALDRPSSRVRQAAIRALGRMPSPAALAALDQAATSHPDPATRRLAGAEASKRRARLGAG